MRVVVLFVALMACAFSVAAQDWQELSPGDTWEG